MNLLRAGGPAIELWGVRVPLFRWIGLQNYARILARPALLELALAHALLRRRLRRRGHADGPRHGPRPQRALRRPAADAEPPAHPVVLVARGRGPPVDRHPRLRVRRAQRLAPQPGAGRPVHRLLQGRVLRAQRAGLRLHVEPGAVREPAVPRGHAVDLARPLRGRRGRRRRILAALSPRDPAGAPVDPVPGAGPGHRERVPDARPDLRPHDGRPRQRHHHRSRGSAFRPRSRSSSSGRARRSSTR